MYNLIELSDNYSDISGSLYQFRRDEPPVNNTGNLLDVALDNYTSFKYKTSILGKPSIVCGTNNADRSLKMQK